MQELTLMTLKKLIQTSWILLLKVMLIANGIVTSGYIPTNGQLIIILKDFAVGQSTDGAAPIAANTLTYYNYVNK